MEVPMQQFVCPECARPFMTAHSGGERSVEMFCPNGCRLCCVGGSLNVAGPSYHDMRQEKERAQKGLVRIDAKYIDARRTNNGLRGRIRELETQVVMGQPGMIGVLVSERKAELIQEGVK